MDIARTARVLGEALAAGVAEETLTALQASLVTRCRCALTGLCPAEDGARVGRGARGGRGKGDPHSAATEPMLMNANECY